MAPDWGKYVTKGRPWERKGQIPFLWLLSGSCEVESSVPP